MGNSLPRLWINILSWNWIKLKKTKTDGLKKNASITKCIVPALRHSVSSTEMVLLGASRECKKVWSSCLCVNRAIVFLRLLSLSCVSSTTLRGALLPPRPIALIASFLSAALIKCEVGHRCGQPAPLCVFFLSPHRSGCGTRHRGPRRGGQEDFKTHETK